MFPNGAGKVENHGNIYNRVLGPLQAECGITTSGRPKYSLHTLRHYCASWLIAEGIQAKRVQAIMGHATIQITLDLYTHLFPDDAGDQARLEAGQLRLQPVLA
ncbi:MAG TPA: site-specific integrase [Geminicoccaceae bacterium]